MSEKIVHDGIVFRGAERWTSIIGALGCVLIGVGPMIVTKPEDRELASWWAIAWSAIGLWSAVQALRNWRRPYIRFDGDTLIVCDQFKPQYIQKDLIDSFSPHRQSTVLAMRDGMKVRISHLPFATSEIVEQFHLELRKFLDKT